MTKSSKIIIVFLLFFIPCLNAFGQQVQGCVLPSNTKVIYTQKVSGALTSLINALLGGSPLYSESTTQVLSNENCNYVPSSGTVVCKVCPGGLDYNLLGLISGCNGGMASGYEGFYVVECSLDNYVSIIVLLICGLGWKSIKDKNKS
ncbi:hypothetical protein [Pedobacter sp. Hv1]|uniref:hypothetical protein n=1 Tax=Pedobacter sp. Hv1 TaxID=1740090 RepID=UPI0006D8A05C|nr:hypothetical protein [Pedobacter sp. Hv1]KQC01747.1 hypothetical protein AQF98_05080 [Pedobacter sp. Hv1]